MNLSRSMPSKRWYPVCGASSLWRAPTFVSTQCAVWATGLLWTAAGVYSRSLEHRILMSLLLVLLLGFGSLALYLYDTRDELRRGIMFMQASEIAAGFTAASDVSELPSEYAGETLSYTLYAADGALLWHSDNLQRPRRL